MILNSFWGRTMNALSEEFLVDKGTDKSIGWTSREVPLRVCGLVTLQDSTMPYWLGEIVTLQDSTIPSRWRLEVV